MALVAHILNSFSNTSSFSTTSGSSDTKVPPKDLDFAAIAEKLAKSKGADDRVCFGISEYRVAEILPQIQVRLAQLKCQIFPEWHPNSWRPNPIKTPPP